MSRHGMISEVREHDIVVAAVEEGGENHGACGHGCSCSVTGQKFRAGNPHGLNLKPGDMVEVVAGTGSTLGGVLKVFALPVVLAAAAWYLIPLAGVAGGGVRTGIAVATALAGLGLGALTGGRGDSALPEIRRLL